MQIKRRFFGADRPNYHHGNLKDALIDAARELVAERGPAGFTLAEAAKRVGVTGAAPYRHFADRAALMKELATRGFALFDAQQKAAWQDGKPDAVTAFRRMGASYLRFCKAEPGLYSAMFGTQQSPASLAANASFETLLMATVAVLAQYGVPAGGAAALASRIWALSHGVAMLSMNQFLTAERLGCDPLEIQDSAVSALFETAIRRAKGG